MFCLPSSQCVDSAANSLLLVEIYGATVQEREMHTMYDDMMSRRNAAKEERETARYSAVVHCTEFSLFVWPVDSGYKGVAVVGDTIQHTESDSTAATVLFRLSLWIDTEGLTWEAM